MPSVFDARKVDRECACSFGGKLYLIHAFLDPAHELGEEAGDNMHSIESLREIRAQEYFLFGGVPAQAEPMYSAGAYLLHAAIRLTRHAGEAVPAARPEPIGECIAVANFNLATREITVIPNPPK